MEETSMTHRYIGLLISLTLALLVAPRGAGAPLPAKHLPTIGVLFLGAPPASPDWPQQFAFLRELRTLGWLEGQNVHLEFRWGARRAERLPGLAAELVQRQVEVIVAGDTVALYAAQHATRTIPIVGFFGVDPVADGLVASLARPGGNLTGVSGMAPELSSKLLELLKGALPEVTRVAVLAHPVNPTTGRMVADVARAAGALGVQVQVVEVRAPWEFAPAFEAATRAGAGALLILPGLLFSLHEPQLAALALQNRLPAMYWRRSFADRGGLLAYGPNLDDMFRHVAHQVDHILKGVQPRDVPVEQAMTFELIINLKTAEALGLTIPPPLLFQATEVIR
jgi:putative tryptophan/tyrosine transport system substrate-binding protein